MYEDFKLSFVKRYTNINDEIRKAVKAHKKRLRKESFLTHESKRDFSRERKAWNSVRT